jgi:large subunit ribosomal protein L4
MKTNLPVYNSEGQESGSLELLNGWLEREKGGQAVQDCVVAFMAKMRAGTACTKTRGNVRGGGAKPSRQKGSGRARAGSTRSPIWRGGGTVFGPQPRSYAKHVNRKVRQLALRRAFTARLDEECVSVVDNVTLAEPKTKAMLAFLNKVGVGDDVLIVVDDYDANVLLAAGNLPNVEVMSAGSVNTYWMLLFKKVLFTSAGLQSFGQRICSGDDAK